MKTKLIMVFLLGLGLLACNHSNTPDIQDQEEENYQFPYFNSTSIDGQLYYVAHPFAPDEDTVLCVKNADVHCLTYNTQYCNYLRDLFSSFGGRLTECDAHPLDIIHTWEYLPEKEQCFYPLRNGDFISLTNPETGLLVDSICIFASDVDSYNHPQWAVTIYTKARDNNEDNYVRFYMGDYMTFKGSDYMDPIFITDSITPSGEQIVCFDSRFGPFMNSRSWLEYKED